MRIGINAHLLAFTGDYRQAGLSRYIYEMALRLPTVLPDDEFVAFVGSGHLPRSFREAAAANLRFSQGLLPTVKAPLRIAWEQTALPLESLTSRLDMLFCPVNVRPFVLRCPAIVTIHDLIFLRYPGSFHPLKRTYLKLMAGWSARHALTVITVSEATRQDVIRMLGVPPSRVRTVHNGVGEQFTPYSAQERAGFMVEKGLSGRFILYLGTLEPRKNISTIIEAFASIASDPDFADVKLLIAGSKGWYYDEIFATAERLGLPAGDRLRFLGRVPDAELPLWYNIATICAYPSLYEGFGLPPLEAMACGTPVVVSNRSALPEVVGEAGILVDPLDTEAWTKAFSRLLQDPGLASDLARRGIARAALFTWERSAEAAAEVFKRPVATGLPARTRRGGIRGRA
jgi:glycosyltransferase involved in cell wall biosynthesis